MERLNLIGLSAGATKVKRGEMADIYLPNSSKKESANRHRFHPSNVPFNRWEDRDKLAEAMRLWLEREPERQTFRVLLDHVLEERDRRSSIEDVVSLCAAVDSLEELKSDGRAGPGS